MFLMMFENLLPCLCLHAFGSRVGPLLGSLEAHLPTIATKDKSAHDSKTLLRSMRSLVVQSCQQFGKLICLFSCAFDID